MTRDDIRIVKHPGPVRVYDTEDLDNSDESTALYTGEPVKRTDGSADYVERLETGEPEIGTDLFVGIVAADGSEASGSDGEVSVKVLIPALTVLRADAHTSTNVNTDAKILALKFNTVTFDLTGTAFTINENETDDPDVHGLQILGGDSSRYTLDVLVKSGACEAGGDIT